MDSGGSILMVWRKLGRIFKAGHQYEWMYSHTAMPSALYLYDRIFRIYFSSRCVNQKSRIGFIEINLDSPKEIMRISRIPCLDVGPPGHFDDSGVYPGTIIHEDHNKLRMFYSGRNNGIPPLYYMSIGLVEGRKDLETFQRIFKAPIIGRSEVNPWMASTPCVVKEQKNFHMFYLSGKGWRKNLTSSLYDIKHAISDNGLSWSLKADSIISLRDGESHISAPTVVFWKETYIMFYSYTDSTKRYKIGSAISRNLIDWDRNSPIESIPLGPQEWDNESMAYPHAFISQGELFLLYSGNNNGAGGIGLAKYVG